MRRVGLLAAIAVAGLLIGLWVGSVTSRTNSRAESGFGPSPSPEYSPGSSSVPGSGADIGQGARTTTGAGPGGSPLRTDPTASPESTPESTAPFTAENTETPWKPGVDTMLVWMAGGLRGNSAKAALAADGIGEATVVRGDHVDLAASVDSSGVAVDAFDDGWRVSLDTIAVDSATFTRFASPEAAPLIAGLEPGQGLLTHTSARVRRIGVGGMLTLGGGSEIEIVGVVDDVSGAGAELVVSTSTGESIGVTSLRFVLARYEGEREAVEADIRSRLGDATPLRVRVGGESPYLRHGDAVLPQAIVKEQFGEFMFRPGAGRLIEIDPAWIEANVSTATLPILGPTRCHRDILDPLGKALGRLADDGLGHLVDPAQFAGCFSERRISPGSSVSRHSFGIAVDLNIGSNPRGTFSTQDPRLVEVMVDAGFGWGGEWLIPDPGHYEWRLPPT